MNCIRLSEEKNLESYKMVYYMVYNIPAMVETPIMTSTHDKPDRPSRSYASCEQEFWY